LVKSDNQISGHIKHMTQQNHAWPILLVNYDLVCHFNTKTWYIDYTFRIS